MKKIIALLLALCMSSSLIQTTLAADAASLEISDIKLINEQSTNGLESNIVGTKFTSVLPIDPNYTVDPDNDYTFMIYMDDTYKSGYTFGAYNFLGNGDSTPKYSAIAWPPKLRDSSNRTGLPTQQAEIDNDNNTIKSLLSGITYKLPERNATVDSSNIVTGNEVALMDFKGWNDGYHTRGASNIWVYRKVDRIHFLIATGSKNPSSVGAYVNYDDGTSTLPYQWTNMYGTYDSHFLYNFGGHENNAAALGDNGYLCIKLPSALEGQKTNADHFVADFENYYFNATSNTNSKYTGTFVKNSQDSTTTIAAYEYSIDVDENKTVKEIIFANAKDSKRSGVAVIGIAYEYFDDNGVKGQVESANNSNAYIATLGDKTTLEQIIDTTNEMLDVKEAGYKEYINFNEKTATFSDNDRELSTVSKDSHFNVNFIANNSSSTPTEMYLITALYDENDTLVEAINTPVTIPAYWKKSTLSTEVNIPNKDFSYARFYVWDEEIEPYGNRVFYSEDDIYKQVDLTDYANGKFYVNADRPVPNNSSETHTEFRLATYNNDVNFNGKTDFAGLLDRNDTKTAAYYPLQTKGDKTLILDSLDGLLHSETGVKYAMPPKREGVHNKEVVTISNNAANPIVTIDLEEDIYEKIHFIISSSNKYATELQAIVNFTDGSREVKPIEICAQDEIDNEHCIANLWSASAEGGRFFRPDPSNNINLLMLEYSIEINNPKVVKSITFDPVDKSRLESFPETETRNIGNLVITALTTQRVSSYQVVKDYISSKANGDYADEEANALRKIVDFLVETKKINCDDLDIPESNDSARQVFISADADADTADGTKDNPFATVDAACAYIRDERNASYIGDWEVLFREGTYEISETITINDESLPNVASVTFKPYNNENVEFTGSTPIDMSNADEVSSDINSRLHPDAIGEVVQIDLTAQGITDVSPYTLLKYMKERTPASRIIIDKKAYNVARWPNESTDVNESFAAITYPSTILAGNKTEFKFNTSTANATKWNNAEDAILQGFFQFNDWNNDSFNFSSCTTSNGVTTVKSNDEDFYVYYDNQNKRFFIENLLEEIDEEGEWYIDHSTNTLYIYPVEGAQKYSISIFKDYMFEVLNLSNIHFEDLLFNGSVGGAIYFKNTNNCEIKGCDIRNFTATPIQLINCTNSGVMSCDMSMLGSGAVNINEESFETTFTSGDNYVTDCKIENCSTYTRTPDTGTVINLKNTMGTKVTHNKISDSTTQAIRGQGINISVKYNDISYVQKEFGDAGAIYFSQSSVGQGCEISNNYVHDLVPYGNIKILVGIYLDDLSCGHEVKNNVIENVPRGMLLGGGKNITVKNNLVWSTIYGLTADSRGVDWDNFAKAPERRDQLITKIMVNPLYRLSFPHTMGKYYLDEEIYKSPNTSYNDNLYKYPANNTIENNFFYEIAPSVENTWSDAGLNNSMSGNLTVKSGAPKNFLVGANGEFDVKDSDLSFIQSKITGFNDVDFDNMGLINER